MEYSFLIHEGNEVHEGRNHEEVAAIDYWLLAIGLYLFLALSINTDRFSDSP